MNSYDRIYTILTESSLLNEVGDTPEGYNRIAGLTAKRYAQTGKAQKVADEHPGGRNVQPPKEAAKVVRGLAQAHKVNAYLSARREGATKSRRPGQTVAQALKNPEAHKQAMAGYKKSQSLFDLQKNRYKKDYGEDYPKRTEPTGVGVRSATRSFSVKNRGAGNR